MLKRLYSGKGSALLCFAFIGVFAANSWGALTITPAGTALGFTLTRFVSDTGSSASGVGPLGMALLPSGNIVVLVSGSGRNYVWPNVDGQNTTTAVTFTPGFSCCPAYASTGGNAFGIFGGNLVRFDNNGAIAATFASAGVSLTNGLWTNPANGHLLGAGGGVIWDITITNGAATNFRSVVHASTDGLSVSPDGTTVYTSDVRGYNIANGTLTFRW